ncbi:esterase family protein [Defluviitalea raffinosedens]|uniref:Esterase family protein n=1 Tax=Defluviitalea raffinosedens TaxID=1450156 RepID=A0A7C8LIC6_9FIRM|nr:alpha/beta hydrolase family protein [Defluviitalea raffinosedens]KAE9635386.1 esterase family protein [Defluviitalea raffinosedens]HHW67565.1 esterase family protein [Candidatus Epulonipiscium sp.]
MALIHCNFFSEVLKLSTSMYVILPQHTQNQIGMQGTVKKDKHPTLYLLHGLSDDHTIWLRRTSIERYVANLGLAVVMPEVHRSFYTDMVNGYNYWTFISEELPEIARSFFPLSDKREDNFVAGLSMGGYGAFKLALSKPYKFSAAASLSGALDMNVERLLDGPLSLREFNNIFGGIESLRGSENDLFKLVEDVSKLDERPKLYQCCGTEDFLYQENQNFLKKAKEYGLDITYEEGPGAHEWSYWDQQIQRVLEWLPLEKSME